MNYAEALDWLKILKEGHEGWGHTRVPCLREYHTKAAQALDQAIAAIEAMWDVREGNTPVLLPKRRVMSEFEILELSPPVEDPEYLDHVHSTILDYCENHSGSKPHRWHFVSIEICGCVKEFSFRFEEHLNVEDY